MDFDSPGKNVRSTPRKTRLHFYPVSPGDSGEGLPYAPEDWPNPGDKWRWKTGKRVIGSGYIWDRYLYLPSHLEKAGQPKSFRSKISVERYVQSTFPGTDMNAFFSSFMWNIPLKQFNSKELLGSDSHLSHTCKAGNNKCISLSVVSDPPLSEAMFCDICCSEPDFCRNCCCILCSKTICSAFGSYNYIRCKAILLDGCICGHIAHLDCAQRAHMVGTVGGSYDLDAEYFCRRCDSRTDLVSHIMELLQICESIDSREEIEMILNSAITILQGSKKLNARQLLHRIESGMAKLKNGANFEDVWKKEEATLEVITAFQMTPKARASTKRQRGESSQAREQLQASTFERFQTAGASDRYQRRMSTRSIRQERGLEIEVPARWNWGTRFLAQPGDAFGTVVREFYANVKDGLQSNVCTIRGVQVDFSCAAINAYYGTIDHHGDDYYHRDLSVSRIGRDWLNDIARSFNPAAEWNIRGGLTSDMDYKYFQPSDRAILDFIKAMLIPHSHKGNVRKDQVLLTYCIKEHKTIDIGAIINRNIRETAHAKGRVYLGHSYLITHLCQLAGVPIDESQEARVLPQSYLSQQYIVTRYRLGQPRPQGDDDDEDDAVGVDENAQLAAPALAQPAVGVDENAQLVAPAPDQPYDMQDFMRQFQEEMRLQQEERRQQQEFRRMSHEVDWFVGTSMHQQNRAHLGFTPQFPAPPPCLQDSQFIPEFYRRHYPTPPPPDVDPQ